MPSDKWRKLNFTDFPLHTICYVATQRGNCTLSVYYRDVNALYKYCEPLTAMQV